MLFRLRLGTLLASLLLSSCVTTPSGSTAAACDSFVPFDAQVREQLDQLLAEAAGERLVAETSRLQAERRRCARHVLDGLLERREHDGVEAAQRELDALTEAFSTEALDALLGDHRSELQPLVAEARQRLVTKRAGASFERELPAALHPPREEPLVTGPEASLCGDDRPCEQLKCLLEHHEQVDNAANACFVELDRKPAPAMREALAALVPTLEGRSRDEALRRLERSWSAVEGEIDRAVQRGSLGIAAALATPSLSVPSQQERVRNIRAAAVAHHLARAAQTSSPEVKWLHQHLAAQWGGPTPAPLPSEGQWDPIRWRCTGTAPELPALPPGFRGTLTVRCDPKPAAKQERRSEMETFELEKSLTAERQHATLQVDCAGASTSFELTLFPGDSWAEPIGHSVALARTQCSRRVDSLCSAPSTLPRERRLAQFVQLARISGRWAPCFPRILEADEGATPPPLPRVADLDEE